MQLQEHQDYVKIDLFIGGRNFKSKDILSKSDPFVVFFLKNPQGQWNQFGKTEVAKNNPNPNFVQSFQVDYIFEVRQDVKFEVRDSDGKDSDLIGEVETTIGTIVGSMNSTFVTDVYCHKTQKSQGKLILRSEQVQASNDYFLMKWSGTKLKNVDGIFDKSDPFLRFCRINDDNTTTVVFETEVVKDNLNPFWNQFEISAQKLCNGNFNRPMKLECWDWEKSGKYKFIGECTLMLQELVNGKKQFPISNPKSGKQSGTLNLDSLTAFKKPSFLDYIRGGVQLNQIIAIDYTGSNGVPTQPSSLHNINPNQLNQYQQAIQSVGEILQSYDYDKKIPVYGFGAKTRYPTLQSNQVLHCFPISGNPQKIEAMGLPDVLNMYRSSLQYVELSGPTYFNPILQEVVKVCQVCKQQGSGVYTILLILTDGEIHDMKQVIDTIILASALPLSIIIIGVGNESFTNMEVLDGDKGLKNSQGQKAVRDIVQFVPFKKFQNNFQELAKRVLGEIPDQLLGYYLSQGIQPKPPQQVVMQNIQ